MDEIVAKLRVFFNKWTVEIIMVLGQRDAVRFNELKSEVAGTVQSIHADNAQAVEFGQLLFELEPVSEPPAV